MVVAVAAAMTMATNATFSTVANADTPDTIFVQGGQLYLDRPQILPCLLYTVRYKGVGDGSQAPRIHVKSAATGKTTDAPLAYRFKPPAETLSAVKSEEYCVPPTADTDDLTFSLRTTDGTILAESEPQPVYSGVPSFHICGDERSISIGTGTPGIENS